MPFNLVSNFEIVVQGQLGELTGLKFILDTGSSYSAIDRRVADRMGLHRRPGTVFNFDHNLAIQWADVPEIRIGPLRIANIGMMVAKLADISALAENADGIIGMDVLGRAQKICIDYERRILSFELDMGRAGEPSDTRALVISVFVQGASLRLLIDTGFEYVLLYKDRLRRALPDLHTEGQPREAFLGHMRAVQVNLPGVQISGQQGITPVLLVEGPGIDLHGVDGFLGPAALHAKRLELDFAARTLRWQ
jgi:predicted aspartyl protease